MRAFQGLQVLWGVGMEQNRGLGKGSWERVRVSAPRHGQDESHMSLSTFQCHI